MENFEEIMTETFFKYSKKVLVNDETYTGWLIDYSRRQNQAKESLVTGYFSTVSSDLKDIKKTFFRFLQFLHFSHSQAATTEIFQGQAYSLI